MLVSLRLRGAALKRVLFILLRYLCNLAPNVVQPSFGANRSYVTWQESLGGQTLQLFVLPVVAIGEKRTL